MKTLITLNIGLETTKQTRVDIHHALGAIAACGVSITASAVVNGQWEGKTEPCLFIQGFVTDPFAIGFRAQLFLASRLLSQHAIALYHDGRGELIGDNPEGWTFDASLFHFHPEGKPAPAKVPLSPCQATQKETAGRLAAKQNAVNGWESPEEFCVWLEETLIPELKEWGSACTALDFETAVAFIRRA